jgi:glycosyltransferase involved in cell wall biosynthesis
MGNEGRSGGLGGFTSGLRRRLRAPRLEDELKRLEAAHSRDINHAWGLLDGHETRLARIERQVRIATVMAWIRQATLAAEPLVSIVIPTRDRAAVLPRAIASVVAQSYPNWELLVCEDGGSDEIAAVVGSFGDPRVRHVPGRPEGVGAARNRGLDAAAGELIAYLDDDNRMHPDWVRSVVWAFEQRPAERSLYGAIVIDDTARHHGVEGAEMPSSWLEAYDPETIADANVADTSAIAHRAGIAEARWDEELVVMSDWDLIMRLGAVRAPLMLPAIACFYYSDVEGRLTGREADHERDRARIQRRAAAARQGG